MKYNLLATLLLPVTIFSAEVGTNFFSLSGGSYEYDLVVNSTTFEGDGNAYGIGYNHNLYTLDNKYGIDVSASFGYGDIEVLGIDSESTAYGLSIKPFLDWGNASLYATVSYTWGETEFTNKSTSTKSTIDGDMFTVGAGFQSVIDKIIFSAGIRFPDNATTIGAGIGYKLNENYTVGFGWDVYNGDSETASDGSIISSKSSGLILGLNYSL